MRIPQTSPKRARNLAGSLRRILLAKLGIRIGRGRSTKIMARAFGYKDMHELEVVSNASGGRRPPDDGEIPEGEAARRREQYIDVISSSLGLARSQAATVVDVLRPGDHRTPPAAEGASRQKPPPATPDRTSCSWVHGNLKKHGPVPFDYVEPDELPFVFDCLGSEAKGKDRPGYIRDARVAGYGHCVETLMQYDQRAVRERLLALADSTTEPGKAMEALVVELLPRAIRPSALRYPEHMAPAAMILAAYLLSSNAHSRFTLPDPDAEDRNATPDDTVGPPTYYSLTRSGRVEIVREMFSMPNRVWTAIPLHVQKAFVEAAAINNAAFRPSAWREVGPKLKVSDGSLTEILFEAAHHHHSFGCRSIETLLRYAYDKQVGCRLDVTSYDLTWGRVPTDLIWDLFSADQATIPGSMLAASIMNGDIHARPAAQGLMAATEARSIVLEVVADPDEVDLNLRDDLRRAFAKIASAPDAQAALAEGFRSRTVQAANALEADAFWCRLSLNGFLRFAIEFAKSKQVREAALDALDVLETVSGYPYRYHDLSGDEWRRILRGDKTLKTGTRDITLSRALEQSHYEDDARRGLADHLRQAPHAAENAVLDLFRRENPGLDFYWQGCVIQTLVKFLMSRGRRSVDPRLQAPVASLARLCAAVLLAEPIPTDRSHRRPGTEDLAHALRHRILLRSDRDLSDAIGKAFCDAKTDQATINRWFEQWDPVRATQEAYFVVEKNGMRRVKAAMVKRLLDGKPPPGDLRDRSPVFVRVAGKGRSPWHIHQVDAAETMVLNFDPSGRLLSCDRSPADPTLIEQIRRRR